MTTREEELELDFAEVFGTPTGRRVLQHICDLAGVYEAYFDTPKDQVLVKHGARALALDICSLAGALPEVPGSGGREPVDRPDTAAIGASPPEGDNLDQAVT